MIHNPRFPHTLRVLRPSLDEYGQPVFDENGDPTFSTLLLKKVVMTEDEADNGDPTFNSDGSFVTEDVEEIRWGFRTSTGGFHDSGEVAEANYKIATQMFLTPLNTGDVLEMTDFDGTTRMEVLKKTTYNWGTNIWVKDVKN